MNARGEKRKGVYADIFFAKSNVATELPTLCILHLYILRALRLDMLLIPLFFVMFLTVGTPVNSEWSIERFPRNDYLRLDA